MEKIPPKKSVSNQHPGREIPRIDREEKMNIQLDNRSPEKQAQAHLFNQNQQLSALAGEEQPKLNGVSIDEEIQKIIANESCTKDVNFDNHQEIKLTGRTEQLDFFDRDSIVRKTTNIESHMLENPKSTEMRSLVELE